MECRVSISLIMMQCILLVTLIASPFFHASDARVLFDCHSAIFLELYTRRPIFQANDEIDQLHATFKLMGTPTSTSWKEVTSLPWYELVKPKTDCPSKLRETFFDGTGGDKMVKSEGGMILAESLLEMNPARRPSAREAMGFNYFSEEAPEMEIPRKLYVTLRFLVPLSARVRERERWGVSMAWERRQWILNRTKLSVSLPVWGDTGYRV